MEKYYTPEIEEFHVGFEFEQFDTWGSWRKITLTKDILDYGGYISIGSGNERQKYYHNARVKYLDREDMESLGFKYNKEYQVFHKQRDEESGWGLRLYKNKVVIDNTGDCIFCGIIKNKSELKKLLKQLNIE